MKLTFVVFFLFIAGVSLHEWQDGTEITTFINLPKVKSSITEVQKQQIMNGVQAAVQFMKFLQEKNFFSLLTKISAVAGPIFSVVSAVLSIAFLFIDIESPEMALMKKEFANLNNRMDKWSVEFDEIKRKIDWSAVQISFSDIENSIISLNAMVGSLNELPEQIRDIERARFINKYETDYKASGDVLYRAIVNVEQVYSTNLFRAAQKYLENDRNQVQEFMMNILSLITKSIQVEASYVFLKYNNEEANHFTQTLWEKKLAVIREKMEQVDTETKLMYKIQYEKDLDNLLVTRQTLSNEQFSQVAHNFFASKYNWRDWFVLVYAELSGFKDHTVSSCQGTFRFRKYGRNIILSSVDNIEGNAAVSHIGKNQQIIGSYNNWNSEREYSKGWVNYIRSRLRYCDDADTIASVGWGSNVWFMSTHLVVYKKNCVYGNSPCYNTFIFA